MVIVKISKKFIKIVIIIIVVSIGFNIYSYMRNMRIANRHEFLKGNTNQLDKKDLMTFLASINVQTDENENIEIFYINEGSVIKRVKSSSKIEKEAANYLEGITGMYVKAKAFPDKGYIIKIPLETPVMIKNKWLDGFVRKVFIIFPEDAEPYLLVLDDKYRPLFYTFEGNTDELLKILNFQLKISH